MKFGNDEDGFTMGSLSGLIVGVQEGAFHLYHYGQFLGKINKELAEQIQTQIEEVENK